MQLHFMTLMNQSISTGVLHSMDPDTTLNAFNLTQTVVGYGNGPGGLVRIRNQNLTDETTGTSF